MVKKLRVGLALQPIATALFANSPFSEGRDSGYLSFRSHIWLNTDDSRTGMLPFVFDEGFGFEQYADYALDVPMYFVIRDGKYINVAGESFRDFLEGTLPSCRAKNPPGATGTITSARSSRKSGSSNIWRCAGRHGRREVRHRALGLLDGPAL